MEYKNQRGFLAVFLVSAVSLSCSNQNFKLKSEAERAEVLSQRTVFDTSILAEASETLVDNNGQQGSIGGNSGTGNTGNNGVIGSNPPNNGNGGNNNEGTIGGNGSTNNGNSSQPGNNGTGNNGNGVVGGGNGNQTNNNGNNNGNTNNGNNGTIGNNGGGNGITPPNNGGNNGSGNNGTIGSGGNSNNGGSSSNNGGSSSGNGSSGNIGGGGNNGEFIDDFGPSIPVKFLCSTAKSSKNNGNLRESTKELTVVFREKKTKRVLCEQTYEHLKEIILYENLIPIPESCPQFSNKSTVDVELYEKKGQNFLYSEAKVDGVTYAGEVYSPSNLKNKKEVLYVLLNRYQGEANVDAECDHKASPLFIDLGTHETLVLSSPKAGIKFDILGANSFPKAYTKKQISWFHNDKFMFLVNPSNSGRVSGIDQMFGDNTLGPDRKFSKDGYHALSKHDLNADSVIDNEDEIFDKLRLWSDANLNGIAEPGELFTLEFLKIKAIELKYDPSYYEKDIYGNEIRYKSLVQMTDDTIQLMFDLWFRYY